MKYQNIVLTIALISSGSLFASEVSDTRNARFEAPLLGREGRGIRQISGSSIASPIGTSVTSGQQLPLLIPAGGSTMMQIPAPELVQYVTPQMKNNTQFVNFLKQEHAFWTRKQAAIEKDPQLKALMKEHLQLKLEMLRLKEKGPEYKKFFEEQFKYWINKKAAELNVR